MIALQDSRRRNARRFANLCIDNGGVYIKVGQAFVRHSLPIDSSSSR